MAVLLIVGFLGGVACAVASAPAGLAMSMLSAPLGASIAVAIIACLRNIDTDASADCPHVGFGRMPPRLD